MSVVVNRKAEEERLAAEEAERTSSYLGWIKSPHVVTCHTYFPIGGGGILQLKNHKVPRSA